MTSIHQTLEQVLERTGADVYMGKPPTSAVKPYIIYKLISAEEKITFNGILDVVKNRYQILAVADTKDKLDTLVLYIEQVLNLNVTDFVYSRPLWNRQDVDEKNTFTSRRDWYIIFKKT